MCTAFYVSLPGNAPEFPEAAQPASVSSLVSTVRTIPHTVSGGTGSGQILENAVPGGTASGQILVNAAPGGVSSDQTLENAAPGVSLSDQALVNAAPGGSLSDQTLDSPVSASESSVDIPMQYYRLQQRINQFYRDLQSQAADTEQLIQDFFYSLTKIELPFNKFKEQILSICYNVYLISCRLSRTSECACDLNAMYLNIEAAVTKNQALLSARNSVTAIVRAAENKIRRRFSKNVQETLDFIDLHYVEKLSLSQAADLLEISSSHLCRLLKKETGKTFVELLTETRLQHAIHLLRETHMKAYEVAYAVGFDNYPYFYQLYKKKTGKSPSREKAG